jgi:hypothetical protein
MAIVDRKTPVSTRRARYGIADAETVRLWFPNGHTAAAS